MGEVNLVNWKNFLKHNKDKKYRYIHIESVQVQITPLQYYGKDIDFRSRISGILNLIIKLSQGLRSTYVMDQ